jgi:hypothetical protein
MLAIIYNSSRASGSQINSHDDKERSRHNLTVFKYLKILFSEEFFPPQKKNYEKFRHILNSLIANKIINKILVYFET